MLALSNSLSLETRETESHLDRLLHSTYRNARVFTYLPFPASASPGAFDGTERLSLGAGTRQQRLFLRRRGERRPGGRRTSTIHGVQHDLEQVTSTTYHTGARLAHAASDSTE